MLGLAPILAIGIPLFLGVIGFIYCKVTMEGKNSSIVVVDRRTMNLAARRIAAALDETPSDYNRAHQGLIALMAWLDDEVKTGPRRYRAEYTRMLAEAAETKSLVATHLLIGAL